MTVLPPEWWPQSAVWVSPPANAQTWPGCLERAQAQFAYFTDALAKVVPVRTTAKLGIETRDAWIRDYGPLFTFADEGSRLHLHDFRFNSYGHKYDPPDVDDAVAQQIADHLGLACTSHPWVLEGGSLDVNGQGVLLTTTSCLRHPNRNPSLSREALEQILRDRLGVWDVIWLDGPLAGDDTDGHIDTLARFVSPATVVAPRARLGHPDHDLLERNWNTLADDGRFEMIALPCPEPILFDFPGDCFTPARREPLPAGYANFLISNRHVFVPTYDQPADVLACRALEKAMPRYTLVPVPSQTLIVGQGALHCLTMQQPALEHPSLESGQGVS